MSKKKKGIDNKMIEMQIKKLSKENLQEILRLYYEIRNGCYTLWDKDYPSEELILFDIERDGLWGVFQGNELIAICYAGERCEDGEESFTWRKAFARRGTFARIGVSPKHQNKGVGTFLLRFVLDELKNQGFDGVRILVGTKNENAISLYQKFGFENCGTAERYGHEYFLFEREL